MRIYRIIALFILFLFFLIIPKAAFAENIDSYDTVIRINTDGTIRIAETISYNFEDAYKHGIFRTFPTVKTNREGKKFRLQFSNFSVLDEKSQPYKFETIEESDNLKIKIGDPDRTITGLHTYIINYQVAGALTYFSDHDELYWNVTGNDWDVPILKVIAKVELPKALSVDEVRLTCYTGYLGSTEKICTANSQGGNNFFSADTLSSGEGLTIVVGFPKNIVTVLEPKEIISFWDTFIGKVFIKIITFIIIIIAVFWYIIYPIKIVYKWYKYGRDPKTPMGVASSWYDPPTTKSHRKLTPAETGALVDETVDLQDISATIIDLARRGYLKIIEEKKNDFYLEKTKNWKPEELEEFEHVLLRGIFKEKDKLKIKNSQLVDIVSATKSSIYLSLLNEGYFPENPNSIRTFYSIISFLALFSANIPLFLIALIFGRAMPRKTDFGAQSANVAKSLKNFLSSQERQLEFQAKNQIFFERLLPFAVAFGVEKIWAERFKDIALTPPSWYQSYNYGSFNSNSFVHSLNSSFNSVASAATPTSSSTGHSSGFSGGSSGGGGGGGGGGSW